MFGRGGSLGFGTEKTELGTIAEAEKPENDKPIW